MRIDKYLKVARLIKRRSVANEACDQGRITVNGRVVKASYDVKENDIIEIKMGERIIKVQVMHNGQTHGQHFTCHKQMAQVGTGKGTAHRAVTVRVNGALIQLILFIFDIQCNIAVISGAKGRIFLW